MIVIHVYTVLTLVEVKMYASPRQIAIGEEQPERRLIGGMAESIEQADPARQVSRMVYEIFRQVETHGSSLVELVDV